ncbi:MAG: GNAT family N-acetyltransferase [Dehalococcoidia bacterium]
MRYCGVEQQRSLRISPTVRNFTPNDVDAWVGFINRVTGAAREGKAMTARRLREWLEQPNCHPEEDMFLAVLAGEMAGYGTLFREMEIGRAILGGCIHPDHRRRGIGSSLLTRLMDHARELGAPVAHVRIPHRMKAARAFVQHHGFEAVHQEWEMRLELRAGRGPAELPPGFGHRPFRPGDESTLTEIQNLAFAGSWGFRANSVEEISYWTGVTSPGSRGIALITEGDRVVGYCWGGIYGAVLPAPQGGEGRIFMMGVLPPYRGRGLGRAALAVGLDRLGEQGIKTVELTVDSQNRSAVGLYRSAGFKKKAVTLWYQRDLGSGSPD